MQLWKQGDTMPDTAKSNSENESKERYYTLEPWWGYRSKEIDWTKSEFCWRLFAWLEFYITR